MRKKIFKVYGVLWLLRRLQNVKILEEWFEKMGGQFEILKEKIPILENVDFSFVEEFFSSYPFVKNIWNGIYDFLGSSHSWIALVLLYFLVRLDKKRLEEIMRFCKCVKNVLLRCICEAKLLKKITNVERLSLKDNVFLKVIDMEDCKEVICDMVQLKEWTYKGVKFYLNQGKIYWKTETLRVGKVIEANKENGILIDNAYVLWVKVL